MRMVLQRVVFVCGVCVVFLALWTLGFGIKKATDQQTRTHPKHDSKLIGSTHCASSLESYAASLREMTDPPANSKIFFGWSHDRRKICFSGDTVRLNKTEGDRYATKNNFVIFKFRLEVFREVCSNREQQRPQIHTTQAQLATDDDDGRTAATARHVRIRPMGGQ